MPRLTVATRAFLGLAIWSIGITVCWWAVVGRGPKSALQPQVLSELWRFATGPRRVVELEFDPSCRPQIGDPVFVIDGPQPARQVGELIGVSRCESGPRGQAVFYSSAPRIGADARLTYHEPPYSMEWVLRTMLTESKRRQLTAELNSAFVRHRADLLGVLRPVVEDSLREAFSLLKQDLPRAFEQRRAELERLGGKYEQEIVERELVPLLQSEVWPIVRKHAEPAVTELSRDLWERVSLWRFGWRYTYDVLPLARKNLAQKEWERFLQEEVVPILQEHTDEFVQIQQRILVETAQNPKIRAVVTENLSRVIDDPQMHRIAWNVIEEVVMQNPRLKAVFDKHWRSEKTKQALRITAQRMEPTAVRIGELLLGTPRGGITPEFARVLRNQILRKDRRWLVLEADSPSDAAHDRKRFVLHVSRGSPFAVNPFLRDLESVWDE